MKFLVVGLGSMGKRRIRNLKQLNQEEIMGFDVKVERCSESESKYGIKTYNDIQNALAEKPDAMIISTPPDLHMKYAKIAIDEGIHFFTEASVVQDEMKEVIDKLKNSKIIGLPSCTMRYHPITLKVHDFLKNNFIGKPLAFLYHSGQYLPDWHPWEDYRKFYASKRKTGACREIVPFELVWLLDIFGDLESVMASKSKISNLEADIDDIYNVLLNFKNGIQGTLTVDVIARFPYRQLKILGEEGVIFADWSERTINYFTKDSGWNNNKIDDGKIEKDYIHGEGPYVQEMSYFIRTIKGEINQPYTLEEDYEILNILNYIEESSDSGVRQIINVKE